MFSDGDKGGGGGGEGKGGRRGEGQLRGAAPGRALAGEESGSPVEADPPALVLVDGEEEAEGRGRGRCGGVVRLGRCVGVLCSAGYGAGSVFGRGGGGGFCRERGAGEEGVEVVECPAEVCAAREGGTCVAGPAGAVDKEERARCGDADGEGDEEGEGEIGEVEKGGDADEGHGRCGEGVVGEEGMYGSEIVDEGMDDGLCHGLGRGRGSGDGPVTEGKDEEDGDGEKDPGGG